MKAKIGHSETGVKIVEKWYVQDWTDEDLAVMRGSFDTEKEAKEYAGKEAIRFYRLVCVPAKGRRTTV